MTLPINFLVPGTYVDISNAKAGAAGQEPYRTMIFGQMLSDGNSGTATVNIPIQVFSGQQAALFGLGSQLTNTLDAFFANNRVSEVWVTPSIDDIAAEAAVWTLTVAGPATAAGTLHLYINGQEKRVGIAKDDDVATILAAINTVISADSSLPVSSDNITVDSIDLTNKSAGTVGNQTSVGFNLALGQEFPTGVTVTLEATTVGATDPDIQTAIDAVPDEIYNLYVFPWSNQAAILLFQTELEERHDQLVQLEGHAITAINGTVNELTVFGDNLDNENITVFDSGTDPVSAPYQTLGALAGNVAYETEEDPARTLKSIPLVSIRGDGESTRRTIAERQALLTSGIATHTIRRDGTMIIDRLVTTYKTNDLGAPDNSYKDAVTRFNLSYQRQSLRAMMATRFPRYKLADDGIAFGAGQPVATPTIVKGAIIDWLRMLETKALIEAVTDEVIEATSVTRVVGNVNMIKAIIAPDLINNLLITDATIEFRL